MKATIPIYPSPLHQQACLAMVAGFLACMAHSVRGQTFNNPNPILAFDAGAADPYPSTITVAGTPGQVAGVTVHLYSLTHFHPDDLDVLLMGPDGRTVVLMSDAGGDVRVGGIDLAFSSSGETLLPDSTSLPNGTFLPTDYEPGDVMPDPAPIGPYGTSLDVFNGIDPNGTWQLFVADDSAGNGGGEFIGGWSLVLDVIQLPPAIVQHPANQTVNPGESATFRVDVTGTPPFGYQWLRNGEVLVPFDTGEDTLVIENVQLSNAGHYSVIVTNIASREGVTSSNAFLNVSGPLTLLEPPRSQTVFPGESVELLVTAPGTPPPTYQWWLNGVRLPDQTNAALNLDQVEAINGGAYSVSVVNDMATFITEPALVQVQAATEDPPADNFASRPRIISMEGIMQGDSSDASSERTEPVLPGGGRSVWFEWIAPEDGIMTLQAQGSAFDTLLGVFTGTALDNLELLASDDDQGGFHTSFIQFNAVEGMSYQIMLDGFDYEGTGGPFTLSWLLKPGKGALPLILLPPASQAVLPGGQAMFQVQVQSRNTAYQWHFNGQPIPDATNETYTVKEASSEQVGSYFVELTSESGQMLQSPLAELQIGTTEDALSHYKYQNVSQSSANGNRPGGGFISIGIGVTDYLQASITQSGSQLTPCNSVSSEYRYRGLEATNTGVIYVSTEGSQVLSRLAVYLEPIVANPIPIQCDTTSALSQEPASLLFDATNGVKYMVVAEAYQSTGNIDLTSTMGAAPAIVHEPQCVMVEHGGSTTLLVPSNDWVPAPSVQWRFNGQAMPGETNLALDLASFDATQAGDYSVTLSNFVDQVSVTVAHVSQSGPPVLQSELVPDGNDFNLVIAASAGEPFELQTAMELSGPWSGVATNDIPCLPLWYTNFNVLQEPRRFFRAVEWIPPEL